MKVAVFSTKSYDREFFLQANEKYKHELVFFEPGLNVQTCRLAQGFDAVCVFVNDTLDARVLECLAHDGVRLVALRSAGFNHVDLRSAAELHLTVVRVPAYSPHGVAEHAVALMLALNRKIYRSHNRVREGNFSLEGLIGFEFFGKTAGIIGTGQIGAKVARILEGFGMRVLGYDPRPNPACMEIGVRYVDLNQLYRESDVISLHLPLVPQTHHLINAGAIKKMKCGVMLINTSRGGLIDTKAVVQGLKSGKIGYLALDVYEEEADLFFQDLSGQVIQDDVFARLLTFPNVMITAHQAFLTKTALTNIADTTLANITDFENGRVKSENQVSFDRIKK